MQRETVNSETSNHGDTLIPGGWLSSRRVVLRHLAPVIKRLFSPWPPVAWLHVVVQGSFLFLFGPLLLFFGYMDPSPFAEPKAIVLMVEAGMFAALAGLVFARRGQYQRWVWISAIGGSGAILLGALLTDGGGSYWMVFYLTIPFLLLGLQVPRRQVHGLFLLDLLIVGVVVVLVVPEVRRLEVLLNPGLLTVLALSLIYFALWYRDQQESAREAAIAEREQRYLSLLEAMTDGFMIYRNERLLEASEGFVRLFGYGDQPIVGTSLWDFVDPESVPMVRQRMRQAQYPREEIFARRLDGSRFRIEFTARDIEYGGRPARMVAVRDVTERFEREWERALIQRFSAGLRHAPTREVMPRVILTLLEELLAMECGALVLVQSGSGALVVEEVHGEPDQDLELCATLVTTGQPLWIGAVGATGDPAGESRAHGMIPLRADAEVIGLLCFGRRQDFSELERRVLLGISDIISRALQRATRHQQTEDYATSLEERVRARTHELTAANERLQELDRLKSKFVSDVSHELRTPVTNLSLYLDLMEMGAPDKRDSYLATLKTQALRLRVLLENILDLSRLDSGHGDGSWGTVALNRVVGEIVTGHQPRAAEAGLQLSFQPGDLPEIEANRSLLARVAINLITNAINYTADGAVTVTTNFDAAAQQVQLAVADTGRGIDAADLPHLFDRFYRGQSAGSSNIPGTGLGLSIVREIVDRHQGTVEVESASGAGSRFIVKLPLVHTMDGQAADDR